MKPLMKPPGENLKPLETPFETPYTIRVSSCTCTSFLVMIHQVEKLELSESLINPFHALFGIHSVLL